MRVDDAIAQWRRERGHPAPTKPRWFQLFWVRLGPVPIPLPHPGQLHWHDLHHMVLGYEADLTGEMEISAFELRTVPRTLMVWALCVAGVALGLVCAPRRVIAAWRRGAGARNLYGAGLRLDDVMAWSVDELAAWMRVTPSVRGVTPPRG